MIKNVAYFKLHNTLSFTSYRTKIIIIYDANYKVQNIMKCIGYTDFYTFNRYNCIIFLYYIFIV